MLPPIPGMTTDNSYFFEAYPSIEHEQHSIFDSKNPGKEYK
jgi:hypothetical protein